MFFVFAPRDRSNANCNRGAFFAAACAGDENFHETAGEHAFPFLAGISGKTEWTRALPERPVAELATASYGRGNRFPAL